MQFYWSQRQPDGSSNRDHMKAASKNAFSTLLPTGQRIQEVKEAQCPFEFKYLWDWFIDLSSSRQSGMGISPITFVEIEAWSRLYRRDLKPFELRVIKALDAAYVKHFRDK